HSLSADLPHTSVFYPLSLHDALPIWTASKRNCRIFCSNPFSLCVLMLFLSYVLFLRKYFFASVFGFCHPKQRSHQTDTGCDRFGDRKSTRLNSSHVSISYAVFCLKKK